MRIILAISVLFACPVASLQVLSAADDERTVASVVRIRLTNEQTSEVGQGSVRLDLAAAPIRTVEMWWGERLLAVLANPNLAMVLMMLGVYGIMYELYSPG